MSAEHVRGEARGLERLRDLPRHARRARRVAPDVDRPRSAGSHAPGPRPARGGRRAASPPRRTRARTAAAPSRSFSTPFCRHTIAVRAGAHRGQRAQRARRVLALDRQQHDVVGLPLAAPRRVGGLDPERRAAVGLLAGQATVADRQEVSSAGDQRRPRGPPGEDARRRLRRSRPRRRRRIASRRQRGWRMTGRLAAPASSRRRTGVV